MRKHMTHIDQVRITKLLNAGVTDMATIQAQIPVHPDCIKGVARKFAKQKGHLADGTPNLEQALVDAQEAATVVAVNPDSTPAEKGAATKLVTAAKAALAEAGTKVDPLT